MAAFLFMPAVFAEPFLSDGELYPAIEAAKPSMGGANPSATRPARIPVPSIRSQPQPQLRAYPLGETDKAEEALNRRRIMKKMAEADPLNEFQEFLLLNAGQKLPLYGAELFLAPPSTFAPAEQIPVTSDYKLGAGDELLIRAWGQVDIDYRAAVDRNGDIHIPKVGTLHVAGLRLAELNGYIKTAVGRQFRNFELNTSLSQMRSIQVLMVGQAKYPGSYTVSALSTVLNTLFAAGGPSAKGTMRRIQLKRNNQVVTELDLYDLLLRGDKSRDLPLQHGDVIFIPPAGKLAAIHGSVNNAAIYELNGKETLAGLIEMAGGLSTTAEGRKVTVERIMDRTVRSVAELPLDSAGLARPMQDGDIVRVYDIVPRFDNAVTLRGNVATPSRFPWREGMRVRDIIPSKEVLLSRDYWVSRSALIRPDSRMEHGTDRRENALGKDGPARLFADKDNNDALEFPGGRLAEPNDLGYLSTNRRIDEDFQAGNRPVGMKGAERFYAGLKRNSHEINWDYAVIERLNAADLSTTLIPFNLGKAILQGDMEQNVLLMPADVVTIFSQNDIRVPLARQSQYVRLEGEMDGAGVYKIEPGETLRQLVARCGGLTPNAYLYGSEFTRESTRMAQQKRLEEFTSKLERDLERSAAGKAQNALSPEDAASLKAQQDSQRALVARLRQVKATGRVVLELPPETSALKNLPDLVLEDGDHFYVPSLPSTVSVMGSVFNENAFIFKPGKGVGDYLEQSGGTNGDADEAGIYVIRADGSVLSKRQSGWLFSGFDGERLMPGDTLVVPEKTDKVSWIKELKDWSQIFYQFGLGVSALKILRQ